jgi:hypothetical protein
MALVDNYTAILSGQTLNRPAVNAGLASPAVAAFVTYSFNPGDDDSDTSLRSLTPAERDLFREAINQWAAASGLTLFETTMQGDIDIVANAIPYAGVGTFPVSMLYKSGGDIRVYAGDETVGTITVDPSYASDAHVLIHEIGHTLGLKHPHDGAVRLDPSADSGDKTVMSYQQPSSHDLGPYDIQAIQALYGPPSADGTQVSSWSWDPATETLTQVGFAETEVLVGTGANDVIDTVGGRDAVVTKAGNDIVTVHTQGVEANLGTGFDKVIVDYGRDQFAYIETDDTGVYFIPHDSSEEKTSVFFGVERFDFGDQTLAFDFDGNAGQAYRLYQAAYDREPDQGGVSFWTGVLDDGNSLYAVAEHFVTADEFAERYGANPSDTEYVDLLYNNVLHRVPDQEGYDFWVARMTEGLDRADMLIEFSESDENEQQVYGEIHDGIWLDDSLLLA